MQNSEKIAQPCGCKVVHCGQGKGLSAHCRFHLRPVDFSFLCVCKSWTVDIGQWAHCPLQKQPLTSKSAAAVLCKVGHGHCTGAGPRNYNCHTAGTPSHCLGSGSNCSGHANAGYCARTHCTPNPPSGIAVAFCHHSPDGSNAVSAGG